jgi:hypothetical protein
MHCGPFGSVFLVSTLRVEMPLTMLCVVSQFDCVGLAQMLEQASRSRALAYWLKLMTAHSYPVGYLFHDVFRILGHTA